MTPDLQQMLQSTIDQATAAHTTAVALGMSFIPLLPFKVGDEIAYSSAARMRVHRITFDLHAYMRGGVWQPGYVATGPQTIGAIEGSTSRRAIFNIDGTRAVLTP